MFGMFKQLFNNQNKDIRKRLYFTFACLLIYVMGKNIAIPQLEAINSQLATLDFLEVMSILGGGQLDQSSIFALGVMPYITASIIIQILAMDILPYLSELKKQGGTGRNKMNQITRITGIALAFVQGYVYSFAFLGNTYQPIEYVQFATILTAGTCLLLWLGDQITAKGIGNGISLIIMAGIVSSLPNMFTAAYDQLIPQGAIGIMTFIAYVTVYFLIVIGIVFIETSERRINVQYANKSNTGGFSKQNYIPFKLNSAGVMPVILASSLISIPLFIAQVANQDAAKAFIETYINMDTPTGLVLYCILILIFAYVYSFMQLKPSEMSENLNKNGGFIPGTKPGTQTTEYINYVLTRLTAVGSLFLMSLAALPVLFGMFSGLPATVSIGGTGLLIVVGVALETYKQLESQLQTRSYRKR